MQSLFHEVRAIREHGDRWIDLVHQLTLLRNATCQTILVTPDFRAKVALCRDVYSLQLALSRATARLDEVAVRCGLAGSNRQGRTSRQHIDARRGTAESAGISAKTVQATLRLFRRECVDGAAVSIEVLDEINTIFAKLSRYQQRVYAAPQVISRGFSLPYRPARPGRLAGAPKQSPAVDPDDIPHRLHRQIYNTEIQAAEVCAALIIRFPGAPAGLQSALARQTWDEGRHAETIFNKLIEERKRLSHYPINFLVWDNVRSARNLTEAICIEQVIGEGFGLGNDLFLAAKYRRLGRPDLAEMQEWIHSDEVNHAREGLKWFRLLAGKNSPGLLHKMERRYMHRPIAGLWFVPELRRQIGFSRAEIARQRQLSERRRP